MKAKKALSSYARRDKEENINDSKQSLQNIAKSIEKDFCVTLSQNGV